MRRTTSRHLHSPRLLLVVEARTVAKLRQRQSQCPPISGVELDRFADFFLPPSSSVYLPDGRALARTATAVVQGLIRYLPSLMISTARHPFTHPCPTLL